MLMSTARMIKNITPFPKVVWIAIAAHLELPDRLNLSFICRWMHQLLQVQNIREDLSRYSIKKMRRFHAFGNTVYCVLDDRNNFWYLRLTRDGRTALPIRSREIPDVMDFEVTGEALFLVHKDGTVSVCGNNNSLNTLGTGSMINYNFRKIPNVDSVLQVSSCVGYATYFLAKDGRVWVSGDRFVFGFDGGHWVKASKPELLDGMPAVKKVLASGSTSLFLTHDGQVYVDGARANHFYVERPAVRTDKPVKLPDCENVVDIKLLERQFAVISKDKVRLLSDIHNLNRGHGVSDIVDLVSSHVSLFLDASGYVWAQGVVGDGMLGLGAIPDLMVNDPQRIPELENIEKIVICDRSVLFFGVDHRVWTCGENTFRVFDLADESLKDDDVLFSPVELLSFPKVYSSTVQSSNQVLEMIDIEGNYWCWDDKSQLSSYSEPHFNIHALNVDRILQKYRYSPLDLFKAACGEGDNRACFYSAFITLLRTQPLEFRLYFLSRLSAESRFYRDDDALAMLACQKKTLSPAILSNFFVESDGFRLCRKFIEFLAYFDRKQEEVNNQADVALDQRREDALAIFAIICRNDENSVMDLQKHMRDTASTFSRQEVSLFGYHFTAPNLYSRYHHARQGLMQAMNLDEGCEDGFWIECVYELSYYLIPMLHLREQEEDVSVISELYKLLVSLLDRESKELSLTQ